MKRTVLVIAFASTLFSCSWLACLGAVTPTLTWDIGVSGGVKTYTYTLLNDAELGTIRGLSIYMPVAGSSSITSFACSNPSFQAHVFQGVARLEGWGSLGNQDSMQIWLETPADIPTVYDYQRGSLIPNTLGNWAWSLDNDTNPGLTSVPVPGQIPEPTSLLALGLAASGLGVGLLRRRR